MQSLYDQKLSSDVVIETYLVDDCSSDGTGDAVRKNFPSVRVLQGNGNLYWGGGMRLAWESAFKGNYDDYLWLNDDTVLLPSAIESLLKAALDIRLSEGSEAIIAGSCYAEDLKTQTYGARLKKKQHLFVTPLDHPQECDLINGNIVLIPAAISEVLGNISPEFIHYGGDNDYGERAVKAGFKLWVAPGYHGICNSHPYTPWADPDRPLNERWRLMCSPKGQPPYEVYVYARRHRGFYWPLDLIRLYLRVLFPGVYSFLRRVLKHN